MMHALICEDDRLYRKSIQEKIENWTSSFGHQDIEIHSFHSSEDLLEAWKSGLPAHIFILDIEIPNELSGMNLAKIIRSSDMNVPIVFVTNYEQYVYEGYTFSALRYLKKPIIESDLYPCLDIAYQHYQLLHQECSILSIPGEKIVLRYSEILYIEAHSPNIAISTLIFERPITIRYRLSKIITLLPSPLFCPFHRSYVVNISQIRILKRTQLILSNGLSLPVSEKYEDELFEKFNQYHQGGYRCI